MNRAKKIGRAVAHADKRLLRKAEKERRQTARKEARIARKEERAAYKALPHADKIVARERKYHVLVDFVFLTLGSFCVAFAASVFLDPMGIVNGGVIGVGIVLKELTHRYLGWDLPLAVTNFVLNIPLLILGIFKRGWKYMGKTICATLLLTLFLELTSYIKLPVDDFFLMAGAGGIICGIGVGLVVLAGATTGGSDLLAAILQSRFPHVSVPSLLQIVDLSIVAVGLFVFDWKHTLYAAFTIILTTYVGDLILGGKSRSKAVYIISESWEPIAERILKEMSRGITGFQSTGLYSQSERKTLFCVISPREVAQLKFLVYELDPKAFMIISDAQEVLGEGFRAYSSEP